MYTQYTSWSILHQGLLLRPNHSVPVQSKCQGWAGWHKVQSTFCWLQSHVVTVMLAESDAVS